MMVDEVVDDKVEEEVPSNEDESPSSNDATCDDENTAGSCDLHDTFTIYSYVIYIHTQVVKSLILYAVLRRYLSYSVTNAGHALFSGKSPVKKWDVP